MNIERLNEHPPLLDLFGESFEEKLRDEGKVFSRKIEPITSARQVVKEEIIETYMPDGTFEGENTANPGDWVITGPKGEEFVMTDTKVHELYEMQKDGTFLPRERKIIAVQNPTDEKIRIKAPWGTEENPDFQDGSRTSFIAVSLDKDGKWTDDRYIIGEEDILLANYDLVE